MSWCYGRYGCYGVTTLWCYGRYGCYGVGMLRCCSRYGDTALQRYGCYGVTVLQSLQPLRCCDAMVLGPLQSLLSPNLLRS
jgi:hypothetical protein